MPLLAQAAHHTVMGQTFVLDKVRWEDRTAIRVVRIAARGCSDRGCLATRMVPLSLEIVVLGHSEVHVNSDVIRHESFVEMGRVEE